jgi:hypothetical protein
VNLLGLGLFIQTVCLRSGQPVATQPAVGIEDWLTSGNLLINSAVHIWESAFPDADTNFAVFNRITIESRQVHYPHRAKVNACRKLQRDGTTKFVRTDDTGGSGLESAREALVCHGCFVKFTKPA